MSSFEDAAVPLKNWSRWIGVFILLSFGFALLTGLDWVLKDKDPILAFIGFWFAHNIFFVVPGLVIGGVVALATKRDAMGLKIMIGVNTISLAAISYGKLREVGLLP